MNGVINEIVLPFPKKIREGFTFENVGFKYANSEQWAKPSFKFHTSSRREISE
jgi:ATP-binding cassette subfamily B protein